MAGNRRGFSPAKPEARARAEHDRRDLPERSGEQDDDRNRGERNTGARPVGGEGARHPPDRLRDDRDRDELEAVQEAFGHRSGESGRPHRKGKHDQGGGHGKAEPRGKAAHETVAAQHAEGKADLAGGWPRKKLAERDQIGKGALVEPLAPHDQLIPVIAEMGDRTAE